MEGHLDPLKTPGAQEISCHFSGNDPNVLKLPDFFKNDVGLKVKESVFAATLHDVCFQNLIILFSTDGQVAFFQNCEDRRDQVKIS